MTLAETEASRALTESLDPEVLGSIVPSCTGGDGDGGECGSPDRAEDADSSKG